MQKNTLIDYEYDSSQGTDSTLFDYIEAENVKIGNRIHKVIYKVGKPSGEALCPVNIYHHEDKCKKSGCMKLWIYSPRASIFSAPKMQMHMMLVGVNDDGLVRDISSKVKIGGDL